MHINMLFSFDNLIVNVCTVLQHGKVAGTWSQFGLGRECSFGPNLGEKLQYVWQSAQNGIGRLHTEAKKLQNQNPATGKIYFHAMW